MLCHLLVLGLTGLAFVASDCGETTITATSASSTGVIRSPNNPSNYGNLNHCVWRITGINLYSIKLTIPSFHGETSGCRDYLEVRDGTRTSQVLLKICTTNTASQTVTSTSRYLWLEFLSNYATTGVGFAATWSLVFTKNESSALVDPACWVTEFRCSNGQCANFSDLCDNYNDCGCNDKEAGCDEDPYYCDKTLTINLEWRIIIGLGCGILVFLFVVVASYLWDRGCCSRTANKLQKQCTCRKCCGDPEGGMEELEMSGVDNDGFSHVGEDTGKRVTIVVLPNEHDRRPRYSVFAFQDTVLASPRVSAYLSPASVAGHEVGIMRDPGELLTAQTPAFGIYGTAPTSGRARRRRERTATTKTKPTDKQIDKQTTINSPRSQEKRKKRWDGTFETRQPVFKQIKSPSFPNYI